MGTVNLELYYPASAAVFGAFIACLVLYVIYSIAKFIISIWTGS